MFLKPSITAYVHITAGESDKFCAYDVLTKKNRTTGLNGREEDDPHHTPLESIGKSILHVPVELLGVIRRCSEEAWDGGINILFAARHARVLLSLGSDRPRRQDNAYAGHNESV
jgi:hypothetical protein